MAKESHFLLTTCGMARSARRAAWRHRGEQNTASDRLSHGSGSLQYLHRGLSATRSAYRPFLRERIAGGSHGPEDHQGAGSQSAERGAELALALRWHGERSGSGCFATDEHEFRHIRGQRWGNAELVPVMWRDRRVRRQIEQAFIWVVDGHRHVCATSASRLNKGYASLS